MRDWMDFDGDGEVDSCERMFAEEMLCTVKKSMRHYLEMLEISMTIWKMILKLMPWQQALMLMS